MTKLALISLIVFARLALGADHTDWTFHSIESAVDKASKQENLNESAHASLRDTDRLTKSLHNLYRRTFGDDSDTSEAIRKNLPPEFIKSMEANTGALLELNGEGEKIGSTIKEVNSDLQIKKKFVESGLGIGGGFPAIVKVIVETMRDGKKVDGLWVRCNPARYGVTAEPLYVFNSASSPTTSSLPPGLFVMWVETSDHKFLVSQPVDIGADGSDSATIRFALP